MFLIVLLGGGVFGAVVHVGVELLFAVVLLVFGVFVLGFFVWVYVNACLLVVCVSVLLYVVLVVVIAVVLVWFGELLLVVSVVGGAFVLVGVVVAICWSAWSVYLVVDVAHGGDQCGIVELVVQVGDVDVD